jgi:hypothetical protein
MVAYKLTAAIFAEIILFSLVLFAIPGYVRAVAMGALDFYGGLHHSIVSFCAPVVFTPLSYFLDHLQKSNHRGAHYFSPTRVAGVAHEADYGRKKGIGGRNRSALSEGGKGKEKRHPRRVLSKHRL